VFVGSNDGHFYVLTLADTGVKLWGLRSRRASFRLHRRLPQGRVVIGSQEWPALLLWQVDYLVTSNGTAGSVPSKLRRCGGFLRSPCRRDDAVHESIQYEVALQARLHLRIGVEHQRHAVRRGLHFLNGDALGRIVEGAAPCRSISRRKSGTKTCSSAVPPAAS